MWNEIKNWFIVNRKSICVLLYGIFFLYAAGVIETEPRNAIIALAISPIFVVGTMIKG